MLKTVTSWKELENLIIKDVDKIVLHTTVKDIKTDEESEMQIEITNCHNPIINMDQWEEWNSKTFKNEIKGKLSIVCSGYNMEFKKEDNRDNILTRMWKLSKDE